MNFVFAKSCSLITLIAAVAISCGDGSSSERRGLNYTIDVCFDCGAVTYGGEEDDAAREKDSSPRQPDFFALKHDSYFDAYIKKFEAIAKSLGKPIKVKTPIAFADLGRSSILGICTINSLGEKRAVLSKQHYYVFKEKKIYDQQLEQTVFHEIGHCDLGLGHDSHLAKVILQRSVQEGDYRGLIYKAVPLSIMWPFHLEESVYDSYRSQYMTELFGLEPEFPDEDIEKLETEEVRDFQYMWYEAHHVLRGYVEGFVSQDEFKQWFPNTFSK